MSSTISSNPFQREREIRVEASNHEIEGGHVTCDSMTQSTQEFSKKTGEYGIRISEVIDIKTASNQRMKKVHLLLVTF